MNIENLFLKKRVEYFEFYKSQFLTSIEKWGKFSYVLNESGEKISHTDWHVRPNIERPYMDIVKPIIDERLRETEKWIGLDGIKAWCDNIWFQQYEDGDYHGMHTHGGVNFSNVLFFELPNKKASTQFTFGGESITIDVEEGDLLTFPAFIPHCSPKNTTGERKTVFVFNSNAE